ncbi:MAG TPA: hypothetical protein VMB47_14145 [Candidatus Aquilonibacter sp.]|nr:hypothetical protein [Candidatus Aquilonibacter sp.]
MVLAIAALLFQFGSVLPAVPAAAAKAAKPAATAAAKPAAGPATASLPDAPLPNPTPAVASAAVSSGDSTSRGADKQPATLRLAALDAAGDDTQSFSTIRIPEPIKPIRPISVDEVPSTRRWIVLSIAQSSAAGFDAYATRRAIENGAHEADPFMRPFANSSGIYAAIQVCPVVLDFTARHMQHSENPLIRHTWWLPQAVGTGLYLFSGAHDMHVASEH